MEVDADQLLILLFEPGRNSFDCSSRVRASRAIQVPILLEGRAEVSPLREQIEVLEEEERPQRRDIAVGQGNDQLPLEESVPPFKTVRKRIVFGGVG